MKLGRLFTWLDPLFIAVIFLSVNAITDPTFANVSGIWPLFEIGLLYAPILIFRFQQRIWNQASIHDVIDYTKVIVVPLFASLGLLVFTDMGMTLLTVAGLTASYLFFSRFSGRFYAVLRPKNRPNILIYGAGDAGSQLFKTLETRKNVVAFIDDDANKSDYYLHGKPVITLPNSLQEYLEKHLIKEVYIALPLLSRVKVLQKAQLFTPYNKVVQVLPSFEEVTKKNYRLHPKPIRVEDVLGREEVKLDLAGMEEFLTNQVVLITGAGGSIGSELARQVASYPIKQIILIDQSENGLFFIAKEIKFLGSKLVSRIASIQDQNRLNDLFEEFKPTVVYHAAAHKHVGLMEESPLEAVKNNIIGSYYLMKAAVTHQTNHVVVISTDKAVRPTNVMGASKQVVERLMQTMANSSSTILSAVRFGNVLGSNGSVIPIFESQIASGGPVTVTDPSVQRYFMTIPEAVQLVLETSLYAKSGDIFILDMGKPIFIKELAETMIRLAGFEPYEEIDIQFIGLTPGEKMFEELILDDSKVVKTPNQKIFLETTPLESINLEKIMDIDYSYRLIQDILNEGQNVS